MIAGLPLAKKLDFDDLVILYLLSLGCDFSSVANRLHLTKSAVTTRIKKIRIATCSQITTAKDKRSDYEVARIKYLGDTSKEILDLMLEGVPNA